MKPTRRAARLGVFALAVVGYLLGIGVLVLQIQAGGLDDIRAYYDAGARLNAGEPLYPQGQDINSNTAYFYPPLFAILFRPLALLPFETAAAIWMVAVVASLAATIWWVGARRPATWLAVGILAAPIAWATAIGQAQVPLTLLTAVAAPWTIALAANVKLFPALVALWWVGRREWRPFGAFVGSMILLALLQVLIEPQACRDYISSLGLGWVGEVRNFSPYAVSPLLWAALVAGGVVLTLRLAPTRWGWPAAVALSVLVTPRLLLYMLMTLLAALGRDERLSRKLPARPAPEERGHPPSSAAA